MGFILFVCGIALVLLVSGEGAGTNRVAGRSLSTPAAVVVLLLLFGAKWLPEIGIDPRAVVNGSFAVAFAIVILISLANRLKP